MRMWNLYSTVQTYSRMLVRINAPAEQQDFFCPCIYVYKFHVKVRTTAHVCMYTVCIFLLCSGDKGAVDATHQLIAEPLAAFARALFFLRSGFDATAAGGGAAGGTDCGCEASAEAAPIELLRLGGGISLITVLISSAYSPSSSVPSQRSAHAWLSKPNNCSVTVSSFVLAFNSWNCSMVNAPLCPQLTQLGLNAEQGGSIHRETARVAARQTRAGVPAQMVGFFVGHSKA